MTKYQKPTAQQGNFDEEVREMAEAHNMSVSQMARLVYPERGKMTLRSTGALTLAVRHPDYGGHIVGTTGGMNEKEPLNSDLTASITIWRKGAEREDRTTMDFSFQEARAAGLLGKDTYKKWPKDMLVARAIVRGIRAVLPDALLGLYSEEEMKFVDNDAVSHSEEPAKQDGPRDVPESSTAPKVGKRMSREEM